MPAELTSKLASIRLSTKRCACHRSTKPLLSEWGAHRSAETLLTIRKSCTKLWSTKLRSAKLSTELGCTELSSELGLRTRKLSSELGLSSSNLRHDLRYCLERSVCSRSELALREVFAYSKLALREASD